MREKKNEFSIYTKMKQKIYKRLVIPILYFFTSVFDFIDYVSLIRKNCEKKNKRGKKF